MLKNMWYVACDVGDVTDKPKRVKMLGTHFVLFRDEVGKIACLHDVCPHRGASLGNGRVVNGCVECPYHGWHFGSDGKCKKIPAHKHGEGKIPKRARVDRYPVEEKYGFVWVFVGDLPQEQRPPLPEFPEYTDPSYKIIRGQFEWKADYARVVENGLDFAHAPFVHPSFGDKDQGEIESFEVISDEWSATAQATYVPPRPKGLWSLVRKTKSPVVANPGFHMSGALMILRVHITPKWTQTIFDVNTPIDENTTLTRWIHCRNFFKSSLFDKDSRRRVMKTFYEDAHIIENVQPELLAVDLTEEVSVKSDGLQMAYRRMRKDFIKRGWAIDNDAVRAKVDGRRAAVVPSPVRREEPDLDWVLPEMPMKKDIRPEALH